MPRNPRVPAALQVGPFTLSAAQQLNVSRGKLRGAGYRRMGGGVYRWVGLEESPQLRLTAVAMRLPRGAAFSGPTAAWLHGRDYAPCDPIEVTDQACSGRLAGVSVRRAALASEDIVRRRGLPVTSALRTVVDLGGREPLAEGVVAVDQFLHAGLVTIAQLQRHIAYNPGAKGVARLRRAVDLAEPKTESPMETRLRMLLVLAKLPRPEVQAEIHDAEGRFLGRPDLFYRDAGFAIEYDGGNHRDRMVDDNRRQNDLVGAGLRLLRFTASDVYTTPDRVVMQVRHELGLTPPKVPKWRGY